MKKSWLIIGILVFLGLVVFITAPRTKTTVQPPTQERVFITPPPIRPSSLPQPLSTKPITYSGTPVASFPGSVPYYKVSRVRDFETERDRIFSLYNSTALPSTIIGSKGRYASFSSGPRSGTLSENPLTFTLRTNTSSNRFVTNNISKYIDMFTSSLAELSVVPRPFTATMSAQRFFSFNDPHPTELTTPQGAVVTQLDFAAVIDGLPVFINNADTPVFSASFNGDDVLMELRATILPDITKETQIIPIISYAEALQRLKNNVGIFSSVSLTSTGEKEFMTGALPSAIRVQKVALGYFYSSVQEFLIPVFVFTGAAEEPGEKAILKTTTVVSAL